MFPSVPGKTIDVKTGSPHARPMRANLFLTGNFAPIHAEYQLDTASGLEVRGSIPRALHGSYFRNGPNPAVAPAQNYHWFLGDGMLHAFHLNRGSARYQNAWLKTPSYAIEKDSQKALFMGPHWNLWANLRLTAPHFASLLASLVRHGNADVYTRLISKANTAVLPFRDRLYALVESSPPLKVDAATLETSGFEDFESGFTAPFTAHPKIDAQTGYLYAIGYRVAGRPGLEYFVIDPAGKLVRRIPLPVPYAAMIHDFVITRNYAVIPVYPAVTSLASIRRGRIAEWHGEKKSFALVIPLSGDAKEIKTIEIPGGYAYHYAHAFEEKDTICVEGFFYDQVPLMGSDEDIAQELFAGKNASRFARLRINLSTEKASLDVLWQNGLAEFPTIDNRLTGQPSGHTYAALRQKSCTSGAGLFDSQICLRWSGNHLRAEPTVFPPGHFGGEPVFVPTGAPGENKGYVLNLIYDSQNDHSYLAIFDAAKPGKHATCEIHVPHRIPYGFHGAWKPGRL